MDSIFLIDFFINLSDVITALIYNSFISCKFMTYMLLSHILYRSINAFRRIKVHWLLKHGYFTISHWQIFFVYISNNLASASLMQRMILQIFIVPFIRLALYYLAVIATFHLWFIQFSSLAKSLTSRDKHINFAIISMQLCLAKISLFLAMIWSISFSLFISAYMLILNALHVCN